ncbi:MAG: ABC transporter substrate-binding protein [Pseudomonadota bacterium]
MKTTLTALALAIGTLTGAAHADVTVGVILSATGPVATIGIPFRNTFAILPPTIGGQKVKYIILDDATDPTVAVKNARKLITEDKVDVIIATNSVPATTAVSDVSAELKTPHVAPSPISGAVSKNPWVFATAQPISIMMSTVIDDMKARGIKSVAYIGFNDPWGDVVYAAAAAKAQPLGIKFVANERYARLDTSVTGQVLKVMATNPDAVLLGGSGTPGALPHVALVERGYKGRIYHNHGVISKEFIRVGGKGVEGALAPTGPVMVAQQLPDSNPIKKVALEFTKAYEAKYGPGTANSFAALAYDSYLLIDRAVPAAMKKAQPGTPQFRQALRDALEQVKDLSSTQAVFNMTPDDRSGVDQRASVLVQVEKGQWVLAK